ncbi:hypothetical protein V6N13_121423 [Hibiscus sabdariffa]|uniref:Uncharacterized protein n=2 Tax=Hibiscus sabdariffa TaxID=183260 RepID=A0ABR2AV97_9ROSI
MSYDWTKIDNEWLVLSSDAFNDQTYAVVGCEVVVRRSSYRDSPEQMHVLHWTDREDFADIVEKDDPKAKDETK